MRTIQTPNSTLERALLGLLDQEPRSGYDLRKIFGSTPLAQFSDSPGAVYPALRRLEVRGGFAPLASQPAGGRRRRVLRMTVAGRRAFLAWLALPPTRDEVVRDISAIYLRFAFMSQAVPKAVPLRFLAELRRLLAAHVAELDGYYEAAREYMTPTGRIVFEHGVDGVRHTLKWCAHAERALRAEKPMTGKSRRTS
jgi:DNA-binding PadR family transcriptional regulator